MSRFFDTIQYYYVQTAPLFSFPPPPPPLIAHTIAQYIISPRPPFSAIYAMQYWSWQYRVKVQFYSHTEFIRSISIPFPMRVQLPIIIHHPGVGGRTHRHRATFDRCRVRIVLCVWSCVLLFVVCRVLCGFVRVCVFVCVTCFSYTNTSICVFFVFFVFFL